MCVQVYEGAALHYLALPAPQDFLCLWAGQQEECRSVLEALAHFSPAHGLFRSAQVDADLKAIAACGLVADVPDTRPSGHALALGQALLTLQSTASRSDARGWTKASLK